MNPLMVFAIVTIVGAVAMTVFTLLKYEHLKHRHKLTGAVATLNIGAAMLLVAMVPAGLGQSTAGVVVIGLSISMFGVGAICFYILALRLWRVDHAPASTWAGSLAGEGSQRRLWAHDDLRWLTIQKWFAGICFLLLAYNVLAWQGLVGDEPPWRPVQNVMLSAGLLLQPVAQLARPKSQWLFYVLLAASLIAVGLSFVIG